MPRLIYLTPNDVYRAVRLYHETHQYYPTRDELAAALAVSRDSINKRIDLLLAQGRLRRAPGIRNIRLVDPRG